MPRQTLTQQQIVLAAVDLLDAEGLEGLSMRRLGAKLGTAATAMYWHVKNRDDLLVLVADHVWHEVALPDLDKVGWRDAVTAMATGIRAMVVDHPWLISAMSTHLIYGPGKARCDDHFLALFETAGFGQAGADTAYQTVLTFVLGTAMGETAEIAWRKRLRRSGAREDEQLQAVMTRVSDIATQFPRLRARSEGLKGGPHPDAGFTAGLAVILTGLEARRAAG